VAQITSIRREGEVVAVINGDGYAQVFLIATILLSATAAQAGATINYGQC
jgi:hypothetical protein